MRHELKRISPQGIDEAVAKAELYRNLNEPGETESICRDILAVNPTHQTALRLLGLSITDRFGGKGNDRYSEVEKIFAQLTDPYERLYYAGILHERRAKAQTLAGHPPEVIVVLFEEALRLFGEAENIRPQGNDDALLRWNRCVRLLDELQARLPKEEPGFLEASDSPPVP